MPFFVAGIVVAAFTEIDLNVSKFRFQHVKNFESCSLSLSPSLLILKELQMSTVCVFFYLYSCHHSPRFLLHRIDMIVVSLSARVYMLIVVYFSGIQHENHSKISYKRLYSRKTLYNIQNMFFISFSLQINWQREKKTQISNFVASFVWNRMQCNRFCCYGQIYQTLDVKWKFHMFLYRNYVFSCFAIYFSLPHLKHTRIIDKTRTSKFYKTKIRCLWSTHKMFRTNIMYSNFELRE